LIGLTNLTTNGRVFAEPKLNRRRALFVLDKVDEILSWERHAEQEKRTRFVERALVPLARLTECSCCCVSALSS
jgi:hypothetical protein